MTDKFLGTIHKVTVLIPSQPPAQTWKESKKALCEDCDQEGTHPRIVYDSEYNFEVPDDAYGTVWGLCKRHLKEATWLDEKAILTFYTVEVKA